MSAWTVVIEQFPLAAWHQSMRSGFQENTLYILLMGD
jgi:hypothetical protein